MIPFELDRKKLRAKLRAVTFAGTTVIAKECLEVVNNLVT